MSAEQLAAFWAAVKADASLQEKLKAAGDADAVIAIAKAAGFAISADELKKAQSEIYKKAQSEISEEELEGVAGGTLELVTLGIEITIGLGGTNKNQMPW